MRVNESYVDREAVPDVWSSPVIYKLSFMVAMWPTPVDAA